MGICPMALGQVLESFSAKFTKISTRNQIADTVRGSLFYRDGITTLRILYPIHQWMTLQDTTMLIYYPQEGKAIRIISEVPANLPLLQPFLNLGQEYLILEKLGFFMVKSEPRGDTLISFWAKSPKGQGGQFILKSDKNHLYEAEFRDERGKRYYRTIYDHFFLFAKQYIPLQMISHYQSDRERRSEVIIFSNPLINQTIADDSMSFTLPPETEIKEIKW